MKNKDTDEACVLLLIWFITFTGGLIIASKYNLAAGLFLSMSASLTVAVILYCDWRNEQTRKRLNNYIDDADERIKEAITNGRREKF